MANEKILVGGAEIELSYDDLLISSESVEGFVSASEGFTRDGSKLVWNG